MIVLTLNELYKIADKSKIKVDRFPLKTTKACSVRLPDMILRIGVDTNQINSCAEEKELLGHELAHCIVNSFYYLNSTQCVKGKAERRALRWEAENIMPKNELIELLEAGVTEVWEIAEYFEVTETFVLRVCKFYGF